MPRRPDRDGHPGIAVPEQMQVAGLCRTGMAVALLCAGLGVRTLALWDPRVVDPEDLGTGLLPTDLGRPRARAAEQRLMERCPDVRVYAHAGPRPVPLGDLTVAVGAVAQADFAAHCLAAEHALLPVRPLAHGGLVGPWTGPGVAGCLLCRDAGGHDGGAPLSTAADVPAAAGPHPAVDVLAAQRTAVLTAEAILDRRAEPGTRCSPVRAVLRPGSGGDAVVRSALTPRPGCACDPADEWDDWDAWAAQAVGVPWSSSSRSGP